MKLAAAVGTALLVSGCSSEVVLSIPAAPIPVKQIGALRQVASGAKLAEPLEYSDPIRAPDSSQYPWIVCIRSDATDRSRQQPYSVFYDGALKDSRLSALNEGCATATYHPLPQK
ncbi:MAG TPA: hypothetical protein VHC94_11050 [Nitrobacter sp.]|jgi:hypothetical protein|nr:hypothetical protein [Nitrobacter sp.]